MKGANFKSFIHAEKATMFKLSPLKPNITISVKKLISGELQFEETLMNPEDRSLVTRLPAYIRIFVPHLIFFVMLQFFVMSSRTITGMDLRAPEIS